MVKQKPPDNVTLPLYEEQAELKKLRVSKGKHRITRRTYTHEEILEGSLAHEQVDIEHVAINEIVDENALPQMRQEGDVLIIPVIEEQVEIVHRKVLKEEIHIIKHVTTEPVQRKVTLRHQDITVTKEDD